MFAYKKSFLAIFMAITLGTGFIMQADPAQNQNTEQEDQFEGRSTQVPLDSDPGAWITKAVRDRDEKAERERRDRQIGAVIHIAVIMAPICVYKLIREVVAKDMPTLEWEKNLAVFWGMVACASCI
jgi:hypothetical protein